MRLFALLISFSLFFVSCEKSSNETPISKASLIADFGDQPKVAANNAGDIFVVFGNDDNIYLSTSTDQGATFSEPEMVATLSGMLLGYSSGPNIAISENAMVITAPNRAGDLYAWTKSSGQEHWTDAIRINDLEGSAAEALSDIVVTPDGDFHTIWIDMRPQPAFEHNPPAEHESSAAQHDAQIPPPDLTQMTPIGITVGELFDQLGDVPENTKLAFYGDPEEKLYWVFLDASGNAVKAENIDSFNAFRESNSEHGDTIGTIYLASSNDGGLSWSTGKMIYHSPDGSVCECCKPSIITDAVGNLTVMFRNNIAGSRDLHFVTSTDAGQTFSDATKLGSGTWKINGCPMDGGDLRIDAGGNLATIWQRKGEIFTSNSSISENRIASGKAPAFAQNNQSEFIVFADGNDIMAMANGTPADKIGEGKNPMVMATENGAVYFWSSEDGISYKKSL